MAGYHEIRANDQWFRHQITELDALSDDCLGLHNATACMRLPDDSWPDDLAAFRTRYDELVDLVSGDGELGYGRGARRLGLLSSSLDATRRGYLRAEAAAETAISAEILELLDQ